MKTIETRSTSARTAECNPIVLRETDRVRLVFLPVIIENSDDPNACVKGAFLYQKKGKSDEWISLNTESLTSIKQGESYKLELHSSELVELGNGLRPLYAIKKAQGLPQGKQTFMKVDASLARFLELSDPDLQEFLNTHPADAVATLLKIIQWVTSSNTAASVADQILSLSPTEIPNITSLLGLVSLKAALTQWENNQENSSEDFWQDLLVKHSSVLSQVFAYPILLVAEKAYVGGKQFDYKGGKVVDFLHSASITGGLLLIEIKTPATKLLGSEYRGVRPLSQELSGAISQIVHYRQNLMKNFAALSEGWDASVTLGEPRCLIIAGRASSELNSSALKNNFELLRERVSGVTIITFDELFARVRSAIGLIENV